jgi:hypothetical protein
MYVILHNTGTWALLALLQLTEKSKYIFIIEPQFLENNNFFS